MAKFSHVRKRESVHGVNRKDVNKLKHRDVSLLYCLGGESFEAAASIS
jgi:hypothetical protein